MHVDPEFSGLTTLEVVKDPLALSRCQQFVLRYEGQVLGQMLQTGAVGLLEEMTNNEEFCLFSNIG